MIVAGHVFLERAIEPLGDAVGLGLFDEGVGRLDAPNLIWLVKWSGQILGAVIHPQGQPPAAPAEVEAYSLASPMDDRLKGGEAVASLAHMPADALGVPMLDGGAISSPSRRPP